MSTIYMVRSFVEDPADRAAFDHWYSTHHLPLVAERYGVLEAWRLWSDTDPSCHVAAYRFRDADHLNNQSQATRDFLRADYEASWGKLVRTKETLRQVEHLVPQIK
jgi:hypothetical protein